MHKYLFIADFRIINTFVAGDMENSARGGQKTGEVTNLAYQF